MSCSRSTFAARRHITASVFAAALVVASCSSESTTSPSGGTQADTITQPIVTTPSTDPSRPELTKPDVAAETAIAAALGRNTPGCNELDTRQCLLPFPSDRMTRDDPATDTGLRVDLPTRSGLQNASGLAIDFTEWNRNDGFSPNSTLLTYVPGIDAVASQLPPWTDLDLSMNIDATVILIDTTAGRRVPLWAELDVKATSGDDRLLVIHPAIVLSEGHHFVVALRNLEDSTGTVIEAGPIFRAYRDRIAFDELDARRPAMEAIFADLAASSIARDDLYLAWDFTVASERSLSERLLSIRDQALADLGDAAPKFAVTEVKVAPDDNIALQIAGTYQVPNFLTNDGSAGNGFSYQDGASRSDPDALPIPNGTVDVGFLCNVSAATLDASSPAHLVQYGHGLLGSNDEISAGNVRAFANESNVVFCATKWAGLSEDDIGNAAITLGNIGNFPTVADRMQQGVVNQIFLGRLMIRDGGLSSLDLLKRADGSPMIDTAHLDYDGNSQGGIMGIMLAAVSPDIERAVFGVPGINYSLLLPRSVDFSSYEAIFTPAYPSELDRMIILDLLQMLWDRGEGGGYLQHLTLNPYPNTTAKVVLFDVAFGDWQVSELSAMIAARTIGLTIHRPVAGTDRSREIDPGYGLESTTYPSRGSAIIVWDSNSAPIPIDGVAPFEGRDPHEDPRRDADVRRQKAAFLFDDTLIDVCNGGACTADVSD